MHIANQFTYWTEKQRFYGLILAALTILYAPLIFHWYNGWLNKNIGIEHEYFSHGLIGLPFAVYIIWQLRHKWLDLPPSFNFLGGICLGLGTIFYLTRVAEFVNLSFPLFITGIILYLKGFPGIKLLFFPLILIWGATPNSIPYLLTPYTLPLQKLIANVAGFILIQFGMDVKVEQVYLTIGGKIVEVAPYCAGLKMLFTSIYVALMILYWTGNIHNRRKVTTLLIGAVIISISANIIRNTFLTFFFGIGNQSLFVWLHDGWGGDTYSTLMLAMIVLLFQGINKLEMYLNNQQIIEVETIDE